MDLVSHQPKAGVCGAALLGLSLASFSLRADAAAPVGTEYRALPAAGDLKAGDALIIEDGPLCTWSTLQIYNFYRDHCDIQHQVRIYMLILNPPNPPAQLKPFVYAEGNDFYDPDLFGIGFWDPGDGGAMTPSMRMELAEWGIVVEDVPAGLDETTLPAYASYVLGQYSSRACDTSDVPAQSERAAGPGGLVMAAPNPIASGDRLSLFLNLPSNSELEVALYDLRGSRVFEAPLGMYQSGAGPFSLPLPDIPAGMYVLSVQEPGGDPAPGMSQTIMIR